MPISWYQELELSVPVSGEIVRTFGKLSFRQKTPAQGRKIAALRKNGEKVLELGLY